MLARPCRGIIVLSGSSTVQVRSRFSLFLIIIKRPLGLDLSDAPARERIFIDHSPYSSNYGHALVQVRGSGIELVLTTVAFSADGSDAQAFQHA